MRGYDCLMHDAVRQRLLSDSGGMDDALGYPGVTHRWKGTRATLTRGRFLSTTTRRATTKRLRRNDRRFFVFCGFTGLLLANVVDRRRLGRYRLF